MAAWNCRWLRVALWGTAAACATTVSAFANCTSPAAAEGSLDYNYSTHAFQYCDNTSTWQPIASSGTGGYVDHIISGTTNVYVNSATSTISFTTNGSVANYFNSSGVLVTTGISVTTNQMSATTGYFSGKLGVGTTDPSYTVHPNGVIGTYTVGGGGHFLAHEPLSGQGLHLVLYGPTASSTLFGQSISSIAMVWSTGSRLLALGTQTSAPVLLGTNNTERLRIQESSFMRY